MNRLHRIYTALPSRVQKNNWIFNHTSTVLLKYLGICNCSCLKIKTIVWQYHLFTISRAHAVSCFLGQCRWFWADILKAFPSPLVLPGFYLLQVGFIVCSHELGEEKEPDQPLQYSESYFFSMELNQHECWERSKFGSFSFAWYL